MNQVLESLKTRRAIRKYKAEPVRKEDLDAVLEAGIYAPTAMGAQRACIVAVTNKAERDAISRMNAAVMGRDDDPFYGAPAVIVVFGDSSWAQGKKDGSLIMGNMLNAAHAIGLGSCWIDRAEESFNSPEGQALKKKWGVPEEYTGVGNCILGYPDETPEPKPRKEGYIIRVE
ncbi:MAG: nitroreductase [Oscillospiraceae bacterium]|nr:nitroreductase [Oscillospiraceae bacterium]